MTELLNLFLEKRRVTTDTRKLQEGDIYFALKGENCDGNAFAKQALEAGAACVVIDDITVHKPFDDRYFYVQNTLDALQELAYSYRRSLNIPIIGLGGSNGKTTTKELLLAAFGDAKKVHATVGNLNNHIGVPLTLLAMPQDTEIAIIEMGTNQPGDMEELCALAEPSFGLLTNIGKEHLELLRDLDGVQEEEGELFRFLKKNGGLAFVNMADPRVAEEGERLTKRVSYGTPSSQAYGEISEMNLEGMRLSMQGEVIGKSFEINAQISGSHNAANIVAAATVARYFGVSPEKIATGIASYQSQNNRSEVRKRGSQTLWLDAYNANPTSLAGALEVLAAAQPQNGVGRISQGRRIAFLGDMKELGPQETEFHREIARHPALQNIDLVHAIGPLMQTMWQELPIEKRGKWTATSDEMADKVRHLVDAGDVVLAKGSLSMALAQVVDAIRKMGHGTHRFETQDNE
mgnify:CR=1 FL=1